jgi:hypothetical protein
MKLCPKAAGVENEKNLISIDIFEIFAMRGGNIPLLRYEQSWNSREDWRA